MKQVLSVGKPFSVSEDDFSQARQGGLWGDGWAAWRVPVGTRYWGWGYFALPSQMPGQTLLSLKTT